jgi:tRNA uridine 5-carbamoylmethylation protein Kti12
VDQKAVNVELDVRITDASDNGENVIVDMTNLNSKRRKHTLSYFGDEYNKIAVIFPHIEWDEIQKRNTKRTQEENKSIPESVLKTMMSSYQPISQHEGFDKVVSL